MQAGLEPKALRPPPVSAMRGSGAGQGKCLYTAWTAVPGSPGAGVKSFPIMKYFDSILLSSLKPPLIGCGAPTQQKSTEAYLGLRKNI